MNDPHVVALIYRIEHRDSFDYSKAAPFCRENQAFRLSVKAGKVRFELRRHYRTIKEADKALEEYIRVWEFDAQLKLGPDSFRLVLDQGESEIIDRNPTPGHIQISRRDSGRASDSVTYKLTIGEYPVPPSDMALNSDIETMHHRYMRSKIDRGLLPGVAYFCLSMVEDPPKTNSTRRITKKRKAAAKKLSIDPQILVEVGHLSSTRGGSDARKREGTECPLSPEQHRFLDEAVQAIIRRAAQKAHSQQEALPIISWPDLPSLEGEDHSGSKTQEKE